MMAGNEASVLTARRATCSFVPRIGAIAEAVAIEASTQIQSARASSYRLWLEAIIVRPTLPGLPMSHLNVHDRLLASDQEPPLGTHIVTLRRGFTHHGIYVGHGAVVHYAGLARGLRTAPVEEVPLGEFAQGYPVWVRSEGIRRFDRDVVITRARSRVGENRYSVLKNNCEHFCEWCVRGEPRSDQVNKWLRRPWRALKVTIALLVRPDAHGLRGARLA
jgi:hypothetical protein